MGDVIGVGLLVSLLFSEVVGLSAGGLITPAYLALLLDQPWRLAGTGAAALVAFLVYRAGARYVIVFGRRRFVALVVLGILARAALEAGAPPVAATLAIPFGVVGYVLPGLIANDFERQGVLPTLAMLAATTVLVALVVRAVGA